MIRRIVVKVIIVNITSIKTMWCVVIDLTVKLTQRDVFA